MSTDPLNETSKLENPFILTSSRADRLNKRKSNFIPVGITNKINQSDNFRSKLSPIFFRSEGFKEGKFPDSPKTLFSQILYKKVNSQSDKSIFQNIVNRPCLELACHQKIFENLQSLCIIKYGHTTESDLLLSFARKLIDLDDHHQLISARDESECGLSLLLGQLIYLIDQSPTFNPLEMDEIKIEKSIQIIQENFENSIKFTYDSINKMYFIHEKTKFQNYDISQQLALNVEISKILIPQNGRINYAIIPALISEWVEKAPHNSHSLDLKTTLQLIKSSETLRNKIESITLPKNEFISSYNVIRTAMKIPLSQSLKDIDAQQCALSAFLTHFRQGKSGSCFASFFAIELMQKNPEQVMDDFSNILRNGQLQKSIEQEEFDFPFLFSMDKEPLEKEIQFDTQGNLIKAPESHLWDLPSIKIVSDFLELPYAAAVLQKWAMNTFNSETHIKIPISEILAILCKNSPHYIENDDSLFQLTANVFCSLTTHPLQRAWENVLAGMAEANRGSLLKSALIKTLAYSFNKFCSKNGIEETNNLEQTLEDLIQKRVHYLYDPTFRIQDREDQQGAFILYDAGTHTVFSDWKRIDSIEEFQKFVVSLFKDLVEDGDFFKIEEHYSKNEPIVAMLKKYHKENYENSHHLHIRELRFTPWVTLIGNDPKMISKVYYENQNVLKSAVFKPENSLQLLELLLNRLSQNHEKSGTLPIRIPGIHTFSLFMNHPSFSSCFNQDEDIGDWIEENVIKPGKRITRLPLPPVMKQKVTNYVCEKFLDEESAQLFNEKVASFSKIISIQDFRDHIVELVREFSLPSLSMPEIIRSIDLKLVSSLPKPIKKILEHSIVHIGDSNWQSGLQDIHYGIGVNPGTGNVELISVLDNGTVYEFLNQNQLVRNRAWELWGGNSP